MRVKEDVGKRAGTSGTSVLNKSAKERRLVLGRKKRRAGKGGKGSLSKCCQNQ